MPNCAEACAVGLLNQDTVPGRFPTIVCMTTPIIAPDPQAPLTQGNGVLYSMRAGPVTLPSAPTMSLPAVTTTPPRFRDFPAGPGLPLGVPLSSTTTALRYWDLW